MAFPVKTYTPFLKDTCAFVLTYRSSGVLTGLHAKEKCTCDQLDNECFQMGVCLLVYAKHYLGWNNFFVFGSRDLYPLICLCNIKYV